MPRTSDNYYREHQIICNTDIQLWGHEVCFDASAGIARDIAMSDPDGTWTEEALAHNLGVTQQTVNTWIFDIRARQKAGQDTTIIRLNRLACLPSFWRGWTQEKIPETIGLSQNHVSEIIGNTNFGNIDSLLSQGHDMDYIASHYRMDLGLALPPSRARLASQGFSRWRNQETSFDELQAEIDVKGWLEARFLHQEGEIFAQASVLGDIVTFTTYVPDDDPCEYEGLGNLYALFTN